MADILFQLKDVYYSYLGKFSALCGVDIAVEKGSMAGIIGANGCGKSTLLMMLDGLIFPEKGQVKAFGKELKEELFNDPAFNREFRRGIGFVFQNPDTQLFCPTVKDDIIFGPLQFGLKREEIKERLEDISGVLEIKDLWDRPPHQLSIGEKRKVAIASALITNPEVLILDEPTAGLDPLTTRHIIDLLIKENEAGKTIITATHDLHIIEEISSVVHVFSSEKRIVKSGQPSVILEDTELLEAQNLAHVHSHRHKNKIHVHPHQHFEHHPGQ